MSQAPGRYSSVVLWGEVTPALDGLRGLAVGIVLLSHAANVGLPVLPGFTLSGIGKSGVYLFFVLSAFLLTRLLLLRPWSDWRRIDTWADYALRRVLRIWPLYLVVLLISAVLTMAGWAPWWPYPMPPDALLRHIALQEGVSVLWSIPVEFKYYLYLPLVAGTLAVAARFGGAVVAAFVTLALSAAALAVWPPSESLSNDVRLGPYLVLFFMGALSAVLSLSFRDLSESRSRVLGALGVLAALALLATMPASIAVLSNGDFQQTVNHRWFGFFAVAWSLLLLAVLHGPGWLRRPLEVRPLRWLGWVSFSAYLWHMPVLAAVLGPFGLEGVAALAAFSVGTAALSWVSWRILEKPLQTVRWPGASASRG